MQRLVSLYKALSVQGKKVFPFMKKKLKKQHLQIFNTIGLEIDSFKSSLSPTNSSKLNVCFINDYFSQIELLIKTRKYRNIIVTGEDVLAKRIFTFLKKNKEIKVNFAENIQQLAVLRSANDSLVTFSEDPLKDANHFDAIFLFCQENTSKDYINLISHSLEFNLDLILPANGLGWHKINRDTFGKPLLLSLFPFAGSNRFSPQWNYITQKISLFPGRGFDPYIFTLRHNKKRKSNPKYCLEDFDLGLKEQIKSIDYYQYDSFHEWTTLKTIANEKSCNVVVLMRDPRDIINSSFWGSFGRFFEREFAIMKTLKGYVKFHNNVISYSFDMPGIRDITNTYLTAHKSNNIFIIKFEDLVSNPAIALKKLFSELNLFPSIFYNLEDVVWEEAATRGSFAYQTKGKFLENKNNPPKYTFSKVHRKGIVGDWKSSFTNEAIEYTKQVTKDGLIELGYEKDMNW